METGSNVVWVTLPVGERVALAWDMKASGS